jgi:hypothetical protein
VACEAAKNLIIISGGQTGVDQAAGPLVVNMAGNRESSRSGIGAEAEAFFEEVLRRVLEGRGR